MLHNHTDPSIRKSGEGSWSSGKKIRDISQGRQSPLQNLSVENSVLNLMRKLLLLLLNNFICGGLKFHQSCSRFQISSGKKLSKIKTKQKQERMEAATIVIHQNLKILYIENEFNRQ
jgi:hypothetical protein